MDEGEKKSLEREKSLCIDVIRKILQTLDGLTKKRNICLDNYNYWKNRYERADMTLALETKLTVVKRGRRSETADSLEVVLKDKEKVKKLMTLLKEGGEELTPNVSFTTT